MPRVRPVHAGPDDVGGQQVRRELDARESGVEGGGERAGHQRLRGSRHSLEEHVAAAEHRDVQPIDHLQLADHRSPHGVVQGRAEGRRIRLGCHCGHCALAARRIDHPTGARIQARSHSSTSRASRSSSASSGRPLARVRARASSAAIAGCTALVARRNRGAERRVVKVPVDPGRTPDPALQLVGVARRDGAALTAAREQLAHRGHVRRRARGRDGTRDRARVCRDAGR